MPLAYDYRKRRVVKKRGHRRSHSVKGKQKKLM